MALLSGVEPLYLPHVAVLWIASLLLRRIYKKYLRRWAFPAHFDGKHIMITGASSGIGEALANAIAKKSSRATLYLLGRDRKKMQSVGEACVHLSPTLRFKILRVDLQNTKETYETISQFLKSGENRVDILINNAGVSQRDVFNNTGCSAVETLVNVDFISNMLVTKAVLPGMIQRGSGQLVNISSVAAFLPAGVRTVYSAVKVGLQACPHAPLLPP